MSDDLYAILSGQILPTFGLTGVFVVAFFAATLLPLGSEAAVLGLISVKPDLYWPTIVVATLGNTLGGMANWGMGLVSRRWFDPGADRRHLRALRWLERLGPKACILGWLPFIGDPLCAVAGWLRMPALPCLAYMAIGKFLRYWALAGTWVWFF